jgi:hypothetical protein
MSCISSSLIRPDAPSVGASSTAAASAMTRVCWVMLCTCSAMPLAGADLVLGLHFSMRSPWASTAALRSSYSAHVALVSSTEPKHIAHDGALRIPALGERAPALDLVVERAALECRSEEGFLDVGHEVREDVVLAYRLHDEDAFLGILIPLLG